MGTRSEWYVLYNPMAGYIAARVRDTTKTVHSGNLELFGNYSEDKAVIQRRVDELNLNSKKRNDKE